MLHFQLFIRLVLRPSQFQFLWSLQSIFATEIRLQETWVFDNDRRVVNDHRSQSDRDRGERRNVCNRIAQQSDMEQYSRLPRPWARFRFRFDFLEGMTCTWAYKHDMSKSCKCNYLCLTSWLVLLTQGVFDQCWMYPWLKGPPVLIRAPPKEILACLAASHILAGQKHLIKLNKHCTNKLFAMLVGWRMLKPSLVPSTHNKIAQP